MDPRTWFQPRHDTVFRTVRHMLESLDTSRELLVERGAVFIDNFRLEEGAAVFSAADVDVRHRSFRPMSP